MEIGEKVLSFSAQDQDNNTVELDKLLKDGPLVIFFYPKAMSPMCTKQSCHFRDLESEFFALGATVVGVSGDPEDAQAKFDEKHQLGYRLLSDSEGQIARQFDIKRFGPLGVKRSTFVISESGKLLGKYSSELRANGHADWALELLQSSSK